MAKRSSMEPDLHWLYIEVCNSSVSRVLIGNPSRH